MIGLLGECRGVRRSHRASISTGPLPRPFYQRDTTLVAKALLGKVLVRRLGSAIMAGVIVETEAYRGNDDPASHAYRGPTRRNLVMFGEAGHAYIYFTYGMHYCLNVTAKRNAQPGAVLIRAVRPVRAVKRMMKHRKTDRTLDLANGPGKLTQAFAITSSLNGHDLTTGRGLFIVEDSEPQTFEVNSTGRIGIMSGKKKMWRFFVKDDPFVSRQR